MAFGKWHEKKPLSIPGYDDGLFKKCVACNHGVIGVMDVHERSVRVARGD